MPDTMTHEMKEELREIIARIPDDWPEQKALDHVIEVCHILTGVVQSRGGDAVPVSDLLDQFAQCQKSSA